MPRGENKSPPRQLAADGEHAATPLGGKALGLLRVREAGLRVPEFEVSSANLEETAARLGLPLAVRSSASLEDGGRDSFAGQFESYLNLRSLDELHVAVRACRESIRSDAVQAYCRERGIEPSRIRMDVIVQRMLRPELAGVAFGVNPVTGAEEVVVEACAGLADKLLAGEQSPLAPDDPLLERHLPKIEDAVRQLQRHFGRPQDVEFAIEGDQLFILQSRPITSIRFTVETGEWTNADFRDGGVSAGVCSPLMASLYQWIWDRALKGTLRQIHLFREDFPASRMFFGRPYWNLGEVKRCLERVPGYVEREFDDDLSVQVGYEGRGRRTPVNLFTVLRALPVAWGIARFFRRQRADAERLRERWPGWQSRWASTPNLGGESFAASIQDPYRHVEQTYFRTVFAVSLAKLDIKMAFPGFDYVPLVSGLPPLSHMAPQRRIQEQQRQGRPDVDAIANEFRHHCRWGVDVINPRWDEDRHFVASLFDVEFPGDDASSKERFERARERALASLPKRRRSSFLRKLERLRRFVWLREELRDISNQAYYLIRRDALRLADQRFQSDDIFFMTWREIAADERSNIESRREVFESYRNYQPPNEIGRFTAAANLKIAASMAGASMTGASMTGASMTDASMTGASMTGAEFRGIGASGGVATGVARVAANVEQALQVEPGSILICPFTEPGWTLALGRVAGVVTETGGLLSHAAVICREYDLPAVLAVDRATERIMDGQKITIDGGSGRVSIDPST